MSRFKKQLLGGIGLGSVAVAVLLARSGQVVAESPAPVLVTDSGPAQAMPVTAQAEVSLTAPAPVLAGNGLSGTAGCWVPGDLVGEGNPADLAAATASATRWPVRRPPT